MRLSIEYNNAPSAISQKGRSHIYLSTRNFYFNFFKFKGVFDL